MSRPGGRASTMSVRRPIRGGANGSYQGGRSSTASQAPRATVAATSDPRSLVLDWLRHEDKSPTMRELAERAQDASVRASWAQLRRAIWTMMEEGKLLFTPDWRIVLRSTARSRSVGRHAAAKTKRPTSTRTR
jgi:hypothetical protein